MLKGLYDAVVTFGDEEAVELSRAALEEGIDAYEAKGASKWIGIQM